jgi:hypothetical protein
VSIKYLCQNQTKSILIKIDPNLNLMKNIKIIIKITLLLKAKTENKKLIKRIPILALLLRKKNKDKIQQVFQDLHYVIKIDRKINIQVILDQDLEKIKKKKTLNHI